MTTAGGIPGLAPGVSCSIRSRDATAYRALRTLLVGGLLGAAGPLASQVPSPAQAQSALQQAVQQNPGLPDQIRQRLQQSGLTAEQVRARLSASGYPPNLLDAYLGGASSGGALSGGALPVPGALELSAIQALGLPAVEQGYLPVDSGSIRTRAAGPASRVFGVDVFRRSTTQFLPLLSGPVPADYKLGAGDQLVLILTGDVELAYTLPVTREGFILIPQVGQVFVSNLTLDQLRDVLYTRLGRVYSGVKRGGGATTRFDITVANVRANQVYVVGEVTQPGAYQISSLGTALTALYAAGGVTERANMRDVVVQRAGKTVATLDLYDYLLRGETRNDIRLETGDVIFVPVHGTRVDLGGAVVRPAVYELKRGQSLADLIQAAGGFRPDAALKRLSVYRLLPVAQRGPGTPPRAVIDVALSPFSTPPGRGEKGEVPPGDPALPVRMPSFELEDGDSVVVDSVRPLAGQYYVSIVGMVNKPGTYPWREGMTLRDLVLLARGPAVGADLQEAEVARLPADRTGGQLATTERVPLDSTYLFERDSSGRYVGPPGVPFPPKGAPEVPLKPYDNVLILRQPEFDFQRTVIVVGQVRFPGTYSLRTKTDRLADVIARTGGLTRQAYADGIRFVRTVENVGRINVNLPRALSDTTSSSNIILQPGDSIEIPEYQPAVKVSGAVNSPGSVLWKKGEGLEYYLDGAGGFSYMADKGKVSVRYANGEVRTRRRNVFGAHDPKPGPGSEVFVPPRDSTEKTNYVALFGAIAQILASTVAIIVVATR
jgi:polysaccharide biosynthesis/export protein